MGDLDPPCAIAAVLEQAAATLRRYGPQRSWIDEFRDGNVLTAADAAKVAGISAKTVREWAEGAEHTLRPLGYLIGSAMWLVDVSALLDEIEERRDLHARREAETRLAQHHRMLADAPRSLVLPEKPCE